MKKIILFLMLLLACSSCEKPGKVNEFYEDGHLYKNFYHRTISAYPYCTIHSPNCSCHKENKENKDNNQ